MAASHDGGPTPWQRLPIIAVGVSLLVGVVLLAFSWPAVTADPKDLPIGVVASAEQLEQIATAIDEESEGAVELTEYDDRATAVTAIESREVYGAIVLPAAQGDAPEVLTASAASPVVAQMLQGIAQQQQAQIDTQIRATVEQNLAAMQQAFAETMRAAVEAAVTAVQNGQAPPAPGGAEAAPVTIPTVTVQVTDVVALADTDPRGAGLTAAMFPMVIGGMIGGIVLALAVAGGARRVVGVLIYAPVAGLVLAGILQGMYGALQGSYLLNAAAIALAIAAISGTITGLAGLWGRAGVAVAAVFMLLLANPISAATVPVEFVVAPWGAIGQWLPPGAAGTLLRDLSYFPGADMTFPWLVLGVWALAGLVLTVLDLPGRRRPVAEPNVALSAV
ncbi:ABC transporter permease [Microbacterium sp.]|uniref:ABC transporter permease n=1 Tax=Microbacterium sp. TaxID=51671 RepID=UPI003A8499E1